MIKSVYITFSVGVLNLKLVNFGKQHNFDTLDGRARARMFSMRILSQSNAPIRPQAAGLTF